MCWPNISGAAPLLLYYTMPLLYATASGGTDISSSSLPSPPSSSAVPLWRREREGGCGLCDERFREMDGRGGGYTVDKRTLRDGTIDALNAKIHPTKMRLGATGRSNKVKGKKAFVDTTRSRPDRELQKGGFLFLWAAGEQNMFCSSIPHKVGNNFSLIRWR